VNDPFKHAFCINLDRRPDRWRRAKQALYEVEIPVERFSAIDGPNRFPDEFLKKWKKKDRKRNPKAHMGCTTSHKQVLLFARDQGYPYVAVFEDDIFFDPQFWIVFNEAWRDRPDKWAMLYLGCVHGKKPGRHSKWLRRVTKAFTTHAYIANGIYYDEIISCLGLSRPVDLSYGPLIRKHLNYSIHPPIVFQEAGHSDILEKHYDVHEHLGYLNHFNK